MAGLPIFRVVKRSTVAVWIAAAAVCLASAPLARADWTVTTADFKQQEHLTINTWSPADGLSANDANGKLAIIPTREILLLVSGQKAAPNGAANWKMETRSGDVICGTPVKVSGKSLLFKIKDLEGDLAFPLNRV